MAGPSNTGNQSEPVYNFFRKMSKNKNIRKRTFDEDAEECSKTEFPLISTKEKPSQYDNNLKFSTVHSKLSMSSESTMESSSSIFQFESSNEIQVQDDSRATATLETETKCSKDAQAERVLKRAKQGMKGKRMGPVGEKLYKGLREYTDFRAGFKREQSVSTEKAGGAHGPLRASAHIKTWTEGFLEQGFYIGRIMYIYLGQLTPLSYEILNFHYGFPFWKIFNKKAPKNLSNLTLPALNA